MKEQKNYSDYKKVPWDRRGGTITIFNCLGVVFWLFLSSPHLSFLFMLFPSIIVFTGDVYHKNKSNPDGTLQKWNWNYKLGPPVLCVLMLAAAISEILGIGVVP